MQIVLSGMIFILMLGIAVLYWYVGRYQDSVSVRKLRMTMIMMEWVLLSAVAILLLRDRNWAYFAFTSYYIAIGWFVYAMFRFCTEHTGYGWYKFYKVPFFWLMLVANAELIYGYFGQNLFSLTHMRWLGHAIWTTRRFSGLNLFTGLCVVTIMAAVCVLIVATLRSARMYRLKYLGVALILIVMCLFYLVMQMNQQPVFISMIGFAIGEIVVMYMAVYYAPRKLVQKALTYAADQLNDGMVLYDDEHHLQFVTDGFSKAMGLKNMQGIADEENYWAAMLEGIEKNNIWNGQIKAVEQDGKTRYYDIRHQDFDDEGKSIGTLYWLNDVTESVENYEKMNHRANFDELTGIYNEAHFHESVGQVIRENPDQTFLMICTNVERFRIFRDLFGKGRAQEYLVATAEALKAGLSSVPLCRYGRIGEDCFCILMPKDVFYEEELLRGVEYITEKFNTNNYHMRIRLGIYEITDCNLPPATICNRAAMACDALQSDYRKQIMWFDESVQEEAMLKERYNAELSDAITNGEIQIYLQPQMDSKGELVGAEALARWDHKEDGLIPPIRFIPSFEENGRITELDICIWKQACRKLKEWKEKGRDDLYISVNISAKDLYALDLFEFYMDLIKEYDLCPKNLKLEITESAIINDLHQHVTLIDRLQEAGFEVEMDDFGSAYSSFNMLKDICVDVLKIDMKFLGETENIERSRTILKSIVDLSKELHMKTVAEGVETEEQFEFLKNVGCDIYQGYYFSKPMSTEAFEEKYF
ncbi:MAG: putative bifunctional diguanylate cyclase/phosphodiesterase [Lachnospiraceae bacterium]